MYLVSTRIMNHHIKNLVQWLVEIVLLHIHVIVI